MIAFVPARGGSKTIPLKNIKPIGGEPLIYWSLLAASEVERIERIYVATDHPKIKKVVEGFNLNKVEVIGRSKRVSTDEASTDSVMLEFANKYDFQDIILIQATSPLVTSENIDGGIDKYIKGYDSLLSVVKQVKFIWDEDDRGVFAANYDYTERPLRQDFKGFYAENGAFYITSKGNLLKYQNRLGGNIGLYEMPQKTHHDLDTLEDWDIVERLI